jgi:hypothetical protein
LNVRLIYKPNGTMTPITWLASSMYLARELLGATLAAAEQAPDGTVTVILAFPTAAARTTWLSAISQAVDTPMDDGSITIEAI